MIDVVVLVVDDGEVVVLLWATPPAGLRDKWAPSRGRCPEAAQKTSPGSPKNSGSRRGCRADGVTVRCLALFRKCTMFDWAKLTALAIPAPQLSDPARHDRHHEHQADDGKRLPCLSMRFSTGDNQALDFQLGQHFWRSPHPQPFLISISISVPYRESSFMVTVMATKFYFLVIC